MYSENLLLLEGGQAEIKRFVEEALYVDKENDELIAEFSFLKSIPVPTGLSNEIKWCEDNWGGFWDIEVSYDEKRQIYFIVCGENFAPAIRGFLVISKQFPQIKFTFEYFNFDFENENLAIHGKTEFRDGFVISEEKNPVRVIRCLRCNNIESHLKID